jgi:hypothetical protein
VDADVMSRRGGGDRSSEAAACETAHKSLRCRFAVEAKRSAPTPFFLFEAYRRASVRR